MRLALELLSPSLVLVQQLFSFQVQGWNLEPGSLGHPCELPAWRAAVLCWKGSTRSLHSIALLWCSLGSEHRKLRNAAPVPWPWEGFGCSAGIGKCCLIPSVAKK